MASGGGTAATNSYPITINSASSATLQYDANGNMTSDGTNTYSWDAENRLIQITYPGSGNNTQFSYDVFSRATKIEERTAGSVTSTLQHIWCDTARCEERDISGSLSNGKQFFDGGQVNFASSTPTTYFYTGDHLGSIREMTKTNSGTTTIEAQYGYSPYGQVTRIAGSQDADFQYAGMYINQRSGFDLTLFRQYNAGLGRWLSRDPKGNGNLYGYVDGNPISSIDPMGLDKIYLYNIIFSIHTGIYIERTDGTKWAINGMYGSNFTGNMRVTIRNDVKRPGTNLWGGLDPEPLEATDAQINELIHRAFILQAYFLEHPHPYQLVPGVTGTGTTSNQIWPYLLKSVGIGYPNRFAPGASIPWSPGGPGTGAEPEDPADCKGKSPLPPVIDHPWNPEGIPHTKNYGKGIRFGYG